MAETEVLRMEHISKVYPNGVMANKDIQLSIWKGEIHALSGENGAGKTTLMKILFGEESPTNGSIYINGEKVHITSPTVAIRYGIGMVHQHFMLVPSLNVVENMILGIEPTRGILIDKKKAEKKVKEISEKYNFQIPLNKPVRELSVGQKQKVEILKVLFHGATILILDEPTAVLTPQETTELFVQLKKLKASGHTIVFISHKLHEVKELCDRITIIRSGKTMGVYNIDEISEEDISNIMVGRDVSLTIPKEKKQAKGVAASVRNLTVVNANGDVCINDLSLKTRYGEIFGIAGIEGNGQQEFADALVGGMTFQQGSISLAGHDIRGLNQDRIRELKVSHIPADRMTMGISPNLPISLNICADKLGKRSASLGLCSPAGVVNVKKITEYSKDKIKKYTILCKSEEVPVNSLSGGNMQKVVLARELSAEPDLIIANQPTRGVDVGASEMIRRELIAMRDRDKAVILISSDLTELLNLSDRLVVFLDGKIAAYFPDTENLTEEQLGVYMLGLEKQTAEQIGEAAND